MLLVQLMLVAIKINTGKIMVAWFVAIKQNEPNALPEIEAADVSDLDGMADEFRHSGLSVRLCDARALSGEILIPIDGDMDVELVQGLFSVPIRAVSHKEHLHLVFKTE